MVRRFLLALLAISLLLTPTAATALSPVESGTKNKGLYVSPLRNYLSLDAGQSVTRAYTVANLTDRPMTVRTHIERFSVLDYSYNYQFSDVSNDWVALTQTTLTLKPYESREVVYRVELPKSATPGGYYYTLYAAATVTTGSTKSTLQAATLLYLTVNGELRRTSVVVDDALPGFVIDPSVTYSLDVKNTGNTHYFSLLSSQVDGLFYHNAPSGTSQLLMPGKIRRLSASIAAPVLPGIYKFTYTIAPDNGVSYAASRYFVYAPLWFIILVGFIIAFATSRGYLRLRKKHRTSTEKTD